MTASNPESMHDAPLFLTTSIEVAHHIGAHLKAMAAEYKPYTCEDVKSGGAGAKYVLSGRVNYHESRSYTDTFGEARRESYLFIGHAAIGPQAALRTVAGIRRELLKMLRGALPERGIKEVSSTSFHVEMPDGKVVVESMSDRGRSVLVATAKLPLKHLRH